MTRSKSILALAALAGLLGTADVAADQLDMRGTQSLTDPSAPQRGMTKQRVERGWGEPTRRIAAVGQPPISRWVYDGFTVYFEYDRVIHTVANRG